MTEHPAGPEDREVIGAAQGRTGHPEISASSGRRTAKLGGEQEAWRPERTTKVASLDARDAIIEKARDQAERPDDDTYRAPREGRRPRVSDMRGRRGGPWADSTMNKKAALRLPAGNRVVSRSKRNFRRPSRLLKCRRRGSTNIANAKPATGTAFSVGRRRVGP